MLESIQPYIGVLGCALAVILLVYCIILHIRLGSLTKKFNFFMQGENGASLERKLSVEITEIREAAKGLQDMIEEQTQITGFAFPVSMVGMTLVFLVNPL